MNMKLWFSHQNCVRIQLMCMLCSDYIDFYWCPVTPLHLFSFECTKIENFRTGRKCFGKSTSDEKLSDKHDIKEQALYKNIFVKNNCDSIMNMNLH